MNRPSSPSWRSPPRSPCPPTAPAVVPPKSCGTMTINGKHYQVKADQITCKNGRRSIEALHQAATRSRAATRARTTSRRKGRVDFYCNNGRKIFFAIRR